MEPDLMYSVSVDDEIIKLQVQVPRLLFNFALDVIRMETGMQPEDKVFNEDFQKYLLSASDIETSVIAPIFSPSKVSPESLAHSFALVSDLADTNILKSWVACLNSISDSLRGSVFTLNAPS